MSTANTPGNSLVPGAEEPGNEARRVNGIALEMEKPNILVWTKKGVFIIYATAHPFICTLKAIYN